MKPHRLAEYFPALEGEEFEQLKHDIKENGQLEPIVIYKGEILDGVNRYRACSELGIEPKTTNFNGGDPLKYVISANIRRRHLSDSQKALIATEMLPEIEKMVANKSLDIQGYQNGKPNISARITSDIFGVGSAQVSRAKRIKEQAPERIPEIVAGKTSVRQVEHELREQKARERARERAVKEQKKKRETRSREVKAYLDVLKTYEDAVFEAIDVANYGKFSPEAANYVRNRHSKLINILVSFNETLEVIGDGKMES